MGSSALSMLWTLLLYNILLYCDSSLVEPDQLICRNYVLQIACVDDY